jgi:iron complex outermembrane receptor protein
MRPRASLPGLIKYSLAASASMIALGSAPGLHAQQAAAPPAAGQGQQEEIIVTSRARAEKLQDVPLAVSPFSAEQLQNLQITNAEELSNFTPGFQFTNYTNGREDRGDFRFMVFRGLNVSNNTDLSAASLVFLDGAPVIGNDVLISDSLERVEVLKGPQTTYFGRSVMTGAINYVTRAPGEEYKGSISIDAGNFDRYKIDAHLEGPIVPGKVTMAIDGQLFSHGGYYRNYASPGYPLGAQDTKSIAGTLYFTPTDELSVKLYTNYYTYNDGISQGQALPASSIGSGIGGFEGFQSTGFTSTCNPGGPTGRAGGTTTGALLGNFYPCGAFGTIPPNLISSSANYTSIESEALSAPPGYPQLFGTRWCDQFGLCADNIATSATIKYDLPEDIVLSEITAFHRRRTADINPAADETSQVPNALFGNPLYPNAPPYKLFDYNISDLTQDISTEMRLTSGSDQPLRWSVGANYVHVEQQVMLYFYTPTGAFAKPLPGFRYGGSFADTIGAFGGIDYEPIEGLVLNASLRWQDDKLTSKSSVVTGHTFQQDYYSRTARAGAEYKITPDINVYGSWAFGVRPGGFNTALISLPQPLIAQIVSQTGNAAVAYKQEKLAMYEVGIKGKFFDNTVRANVSAYKGKLFDQQADQTAITTIDIIQYGGRFDIITNNGVVNVWGVEADADWKVAPILDLSGTFGWNHTQVEGTNSYVTYLVTGNYHVDDGKQMPGSPEYTFTLGADLHDHLWESWDWYGHADVSYKGKQFIDQENLAWIPSVYIVGAQAGIKNDNYSIGLWVSNLTDNKTIIGAQISSDENSGSGNSLRVGLRDPRTFGGRIKYSFDAGTLSEATTTAYTPPPVQAPMPAPKAATSYMVFFDFNKSDLTSQAVSIVDTAAANAMSMKVTQLVVTGHTDTVGSDAYNMRLSRRRAESVAAELEKKGVPASEIEIVAKGKHDLLVPTKDGVKEPQNRRVQIVYSGAGA